MKRLDLAEVVLTLKASGVVEVKNFRWLEPPEARALDRAETLLTDLGAIDDGTGAITDLGRRMLAFPVHPRYARMLLAAQEFGCVRPVALIAALTQGRDLLVRQPDSRAEDAPVIIMTWTASRTFSFLCAPGVTPSATAFTWSAAGALAFTRKPRARSGRCSNSSCASPGKRGWTSAKSPSTMRRCSAAFSWAFPISSRGASMPNLRCELVHGRRGVLARESVVRDAPLFVVSEVREVESSGGRERNLNVRLNLATAVKEEWLRELFPRDFQESRAVTYDAALRRVVARSNGAFAICCWRKVSRKSAIGRSGGAFGAGSDRGALRAGKLERIRRAMDRARQSFARMDAGTELPAIDVRIARRSSSIFAMARSVTARSKTVRCCRW